MDLTTPGGQASVIRALHWVAANCPGYYERAAGKLRFKPAAPVGYFIEYSYSLLHLCIQQTPDRQSFLATILQSSGTIDSFSAGLQLGYSCLCMTKGNNGKVSLRDNNDIKTLIDAYKRSLGKNVHM